MESICNIIFKHFHTQSNIAQAGLELATQLRISLNFGSSHSYLQSAWNYEYAPLYLVSAVQGIEPRTPCMLGEHFIHQATCPAPLNHHLENSHAQVFESHSDFLQLSPPLFFHVVGNLSQGGGKLCLKPVVSEVGLELGSYIKSFFPCLNKYLKSHTCYHVASVGGIMLMHAPATVLFAMKSVWNFYDLEFKNYYYFYNLRSTR